MVVTYNYGFIFIIYVKSLDIKLKMKCSIVEFLVLEHQQADVLKVIYF
jgi:hypothetical protein